MLKRSLRTSPLDCSNSDEVESGKCSPISIRCEKISVIKAFAWSQEVYVGYSGCMRVFFVSSPYRIYSCLSANHFGNKYHHILVINSEEENGLPRKGMIPPR